MFSSDHSIAAFYPPHMLLLSYILEFINREGTTETLSSVDHAQPIRVGTTQAFGSNPRCAHVPIYSLATFLRNLPPELLTVYIGL